MNPCAPGTLERDAWYEARIAALVAENASLRLYAPARRAQASVKTAPIGECNLAYWRLAHETDAEFSAWGKEYTEVTA